MSTNIYIIRLERGNYYVGKSDNPTHRFNQHVAGNGSMWTKKYRPLELVNVITNASHFDEDKHVKELMAIYGIDKVRGGTYVQEILSESQKEIITNEIRGATNKCIRCGKTGHFVNTCWTKNSKNCDRCGRTSHQSSNCYAVTHVDGYKLLENPELIIKGIVSGLVEYVIEDIVESITQWWLQ
jgi:predicted GIY-YIG superfamily endonuclease